MCDWYDDPVFDSMRETIDGYVFEGDDWRRLMGLRERGNVRIIHVAGVTFRLESLKTAMETPGHPTAFLVADPTNRHDKNAIKVMVNGQHVGFVPKSCNTDISPDASVHVAKMSSDPPHVALVVEC